jgi:hypothetical protein
MMLFLGLLDIRQQRSLRAARAVGIALGGDHRHVLEELCYARVRTYRFRNVREAHMRNLLLTLDDLPLFEQMMTEEVQHRRYQGRHIRLHDAGDFYSKRFSCALCSGLCVPDGRLP